MMQVDPSGLKSPFPEAKPNSFKVSILRFLVFGLFCFSVDAASSSSCVSCEAKRLEAIVITDKTCSVCSVDYSTKFLKDNFTNLNFKILHYQDKKAKKLIKKYTIDRLPSFIILD